MRVSAKSLAGRVGWQPARGRILSCAAPLAGAFEVGSSSECAVMPSPPIDCRRVHLLPAPESQANIRDPRPSRGVVTGSTDGNPLAFLQQLQLQGRADCRRKTNTPHNDGAVLAGHRSKQQLQPSKHSLWRVQHWIWFKTHRHGTGEIHLGSGSFEEERTIQWNNVA